MTLDLLSETQAGKATAVNNLVIACRQATLFGIKPSTTSGLVLGLYGGYWESNGVVYELADTTVTLTGGGICYVECSSSGVVRSVFGGTFDKEYTPLYKITTDSSTFSTPEDKRPFFGNDRGFSGLISIGMSAANYTLSYLQARCDILQFTGSIGAARNVVVPLRPKQWTVFNNTTGGFGLQFIGSSGTGVTVANGKRAIIYSNGTNVVRVSPDT